MDDQHVYHHYDNDNARINVKVEKNSRGYNYEATVTGAKTPEEALALLHRTLVELRNTYDVPPAPMKAE